MRISEKEGKEFVYDIIRKKDVALTPEEWVRQQIIHYLINDLKYPPSLFSVEKQIKIGTLRKRYDIVIYQQDQPWMIIECKEEKEQLDKNVLQQIMAYNSELKVSYLVLTNGQELLVYNIKANTWIKSLPPFK